MNDIAEGLGTGIEGVLAGRAVERDRGEGIAERGAAASDHPDACANCGALAPDNYCPECGQKTHLHRSLSTIGHDLVHGVLHLDGKFWGTLPLLIFRPGKLTRRYIEGERARFVSPMAMFLFSVFAMFAVFQMVGMTAPTEFGGPGPMAARVEATAALKEAREELQSIAPGDGENRELLEVRIARLNEALDLIDRGENFSFENADGQLIQQEINLGGFEFIERTIIKKWRQNPTLMLYKLQANGYKFSWLLIPLSIPFVWLLFAWRRRLNAYDHAVFVTYSLSFMSLLFITTSLIGISPVGRNMALATFFIAASLHVYKHLKYTYELGRFSTIWRFLVLSAFIVIVVGLFLQVLLLLGAF